jgi:hypothetical protein
MTDDESTTIELDPDEFDKGVRSVIRELEENSDFPDIIDEDALFGFVAEVAQEFKERNEGDTDD